jgi:hypothetical protein
MAQRDPVEKSATAVRESVLCSLNCAVSSLQCYSRYCRVFVVSATTTIENTVPVITGRGTFSLTNIWGSVTESIILIVGDLLLTVDAAEVWTESQISEMR